MAPVKLNCSNSMGKFVPGVPPPPPSPTFYLPSLHVPDFSCPTIPSSSKLSSSLTNELIWNAMLWLFSNGKNVERQASDYILFNATVPYYLKDNKVTPAWIFGGIRGDFPPEHIKLTPGNTICPQDTACSWLQFTPESPTLFSVFIQPSWHEPGYHVCKFSIHVLSYDGLIPINIQSVLVAIPTHLIPGDQHLCEIKEISLGQRILVQDIILNWNKECGVSEKL